MIEQQNVAEAFKVYRKMVDESKNMLSFGQLLPLMQLCANEKKTDMLEKVVDDMENMVKKANNRGEHMRYRTPFPCTPYNLLLQSYVRTGPLHKAIDLYKRMLTPNNPTRVVPTSSTLNLLLMVYHHEWNMKGFEELYQQMRHNVTAELPNEIAVWRRPETTADASRALKKWRFFQNYIASQKRESDGELTTLPIPPFVCATRVTENIRVMAYTSTGRLDEALEAIQHALVGYPPGTMDALTLPSFEGMVSYFMQRQGVDDMTVRRLQRSIAEKCMEVMINVPVSKETVDDYLTSLENMVKSNVAEMTA
jgi:pentatricopeptide repeat protein